MEKSFVTKSVTKTCNGLNLVCISVCNVITILVTKNYSVTILVMDNNSITILVTDIYAVTIIEMDCQAVTKVVTKSVTDPLLNW